MDFSKIKNFVGVFFDKQNWAVVPRTWLLFKDGLKCYWPPSGEPQELASRCTVPDKNSWGLWKVEKINATSDDYERTRKKMLENIASSDSEAQIQDTTIQRINNSEESKVKKKQRSLKRAIHINNNSSSSSEEDSVSNELHVALTPSDDLAPSLKPNTGQVIETSQMLIGLEANEISMKLDIMLEEMQKLNTKFEVLQRNYTSLALRMEEHSCNKTVCEPSFSDSETTRRVLVLKRATNVEELDHLVSNTDIVPYLLKGVDFSLTRTISNMAKLLMTRELAMKFSLTGLGSKRMKNKLQFKNSAAYKVIECAVYQNDQFKSNTNKDFQKAVGIVLKNSIDWDGHRNKRSTRTCLENSSGSSPSLSDDNNTLHPQIFSSCTIEKFEL